MATRKIEYQDKEAIQDLSIPAKNQVTDLDMNEIKSVVNNNADITEDTEEAVETFIEGASSRLNGFDSDIADINSDIADINTNISSIEDDLDNVYTKTETDSLLSNKANTSDIPTDLSQLSNATTKFVNETQLTNAVDLEKTARENADNNLQGQIDAISASSDVVDIVGTYQDLLNYDTSKLGDNDIIKVLQDSTHNNAVSYYRWKKQQSTWLYIGSEGPFYTKSEADSTFVAKVQGKGLSTNDFTDSLKTKLEGIETGAQVNVIEGITLNGSSLTPTSKVVALTNIEQTTNKSTSISSSSTDTQYASAKAVYSYVNTVVGDIETILYNLNRGGGVE